MSRGEQRDVSSRSGDSGQPTRTWKRAPAGERRTANALRAESARRVADPAYAPEDAGEPPSPPSSTAPTVAPDEGVVDTQPVEAASSFMARLRYLFASTCQRNGAAWSLNAVSRASQGRLSPQAIYRLYSGLTTNPSLQTIRTLAEVFGVETDYFVRADGLAQQHAQTQAAFAQIADDPTIAFVSRRMGQMSPADKALTVDFVRRLTRDASERGTLDERGAADGGADALSAVSLEASGEMRHDLMGHPLMESAPAQSVLVPSESQETSPDDLSDTRAWSRQTREKGG